MRSKRAKSADVAGADTDTVDVAGDDGDESAVAIAGAGDNGDEDAISGRDGVAGGKTVLISIAAAAVIGAVLLIAGYAYSVNRPLDFGDETYLIESGDTLDEVAADLISRGVIGSDIVLKLIAIPGDRSRHIRPGEYRFPPDTTLADFLDYIVSGGEQIGFKTTILEGWTFRQMREHLRTRKKLKHETAGLTDRQLMAKLGHPDLHPEGRFFPDTYSYTAGQSDFTIYRQAFDLMAQKLAAAWQNRDPGVPLADADEALILASIIEKESWIAVEQRKIAGVFYNRLKKGMRLQTDPTVIYGLGDKFDGNLTRRHLKTPTPYNTYTKHGLPPTPISLPGADSLAAVMHPTPTNAYYFVASGGGKHQFSQTLAQHNKAVWKHIRSKRAGKKSE